MYATFDFSLHVKVLECGFIDSREWRCIIVTTPVSIDFQCMSVTVKCTIVNPGIHAHRSCDTDVCIHNGIDFARAFCVHHGITELVPVIRRTDNHVFLAVYGSSTAAEHIVELGVMTVGHSQFACSSGACKCLAAVQFCSEP